MGSNLFNLLCAGADRLLCAGRHPISSTVLSVDLLFMVAVAVACLPIFLTGNVISRGRAPSFWLLRGVYRRICCSTPPITCACCSTATLCCFRRAAHCAHPGHRGR